MKTLEQIQEENRKAIILANNPEAKDYDEALEMELGVGCRFDSGESVFFIFRETMEHLYFSQEGDFWIEKLRPEHIKDHRIIGKPLTLDRVLIGASKVSLTYYPHSNGLNLNSHIIWELLAMWNLTKPTLEDQSEETQRVINKLLIK
jgi:hypothetical protein